MQEQGSGVSPAIFSVGSMKAQRRRHMHRGRVHTWVTCVLSCLHSQPFRPRPPGQEVPLTTAWDAHNVLQRTRV